MSVSVLLSTQMRQPTSWDDPGLLHDEPFYSVFRACRRLMELSHGTNLDAIRALDTLAKGFQMPGKEDVALTWLGLAYPPNSRDNRGSRYKQQQSEDDFRSFVEFYWRTFQEDNPDAYLSHQRKERGYVKDLPTARKAAPTNPQKNHNLTTPSVSTPNLRDRPFEQNTSLLEFQGHSLMSPGRRGEAYSIGVSQSTETSKTKDFPLQMQKTSPKTSKKTSKVKGRTNHSLEGFVIDTTTLDNEHYPYPRISPGSPIVPDASLTPLVNVGMQDQGSLTPPNTFESGHVRQTCTTTILKDSGVKSYFKQDLSTDILNRKAPDCLLPVIDYPTTMMRDPSVVDAPFAESATKDTSPPQNLPLDVRQPSKTISVTGLNPHIYPDSDRNKRRPMDGIGSNSSSPKFQTVSYGKPKLPWLPPIWAQSRQEVCESFDWFRSYQGGVYFCNNIVKGYLLSAFSSCRDIFEHGGKLIISHGGGGAESVHHHHGQAMNEAAVDQNAQDKSVRALLQNFKEARPLVLLIDDKYVLFPYDLGSLNVTYAVLGFYTITHAWAEYQPANNIEGRVVRYKFAFEWCRGQGEPWWLQTTESNWRDTLPRPPRHKNPPSPGGNKYPVKVAEHKLSDSGQSRPDDVYLTCGTCHQKTPQVYRQQWVCLNRVCTRFWITRNGTLPPPLLEYNPDFLRLSCLHVLPASLIDIRPTSPVPSVKDIMMTHAFTRGWHCQVCGRLSCRFKWEEWVCSHCEATFRPDIRVHTASDFWPLNFPTTSYYDYSMAKTSGIVQEAMKTFFLAEGMGQTQTFVLPDGKGRIHHIRSGTWNSEEADEIFKDYQEQAASGKLHFRRWPLRSHKCRGPLLTNYFSQNCELYHARTFQQLMYLAGEPYQYVGGTANTVPFSKAPGAVVKAIFFIQARIRQALGIDSAFNEVLSAAYMEGQKMAFHSDAEPGLGPLVAGLSLGSSALMHFRPHSTPKAHPVVLSFVLRHGDVLVMDGADVQRHYEHTVVPTNFRIAATARNIHHPHV